MEKLEYIIEGEGATPVVWRVVESLLKRPVSEDQRKEGIIMTIVPDALNVLRRKRLAEFLVAE